MANDSYTVDADGKVFAGRYKLPNWVSGTKNREWSTVGTNTLSDLDPANDPAINPNYPASAPWRGSTGFSSVVSAYNGAVWMEDGLYIFGGGHADYAGNELYKWDKETGLFERLTLPTGAIGNTGTLNDGLESSGVYFDGQPRSFHTYNNFAVRNGVLWFFGGSAYYSGNPYSRPFYYDKANSTWVMDMDSGVGATYGAATYDSTRDVFWIFRSGNHQFRSYDPNTKTMTVSNRYNDLNTYCAGFYDATSDCLIYADATNFRAIPADMSTNNVITTSTGKPTLSNLCQRGIAQDTVNRILYVRGEGTDIWKVQIPTNPMTESFVWTQLANTGTLTTPQAAGTYGRLWYDPKTRCIGVLDSVSSNMYVLKLKS